VDPPLFQAAQQRLKETNQTAGYGIHSEAIDHWDGIHDAFCQYVQSTQTHLETCVSSTAEVVARPDYLHSGFTSLLRIPVLSWPAQAWLEAQANAIDRLRS
jgi:hypothetical protein